jgi:predicted  nucleic acid-binding Zn-ribbon protein
MFQCERCGSRYSAMHAATWESCPRCQIRDRASAPLTFKAFERQPIRAGSAASPSPAPRPSGSSPVRA